ncbi:MAG TPA: VOC family protein, partial [Reyranella sp.]|nr:VOC family protein [Reyranella sp.]
MATTSTDNDRRIDYVEFDVADVARGAGGPLVILYANDLLDIQRRIEAAGGRIVKAAYDFP